MLKVSSVATVVAAVIVLLGVTAHAGSFSGAISTTLTSTTSGTCDVNSICPSGDCTCLVYDGTVSGSVGKGTAEVDATEDNGLATTPGALLSLQKCSSQRAKIPTRRLMGSELSARCPRLRPTRNSRADSTSLRLTLAPPAGVCSPLPLPARLIVWSYTTRARIDDPCSSAVEEMRAFMRAEQRARWLAMPCLPIGRQADLIKAGREAFVRGSRYCVRTRLARRNSRLYTISWHPSGSAFRGASSSWTVPVPVLPITR